MGKKRFVTALAAVALAGAGFAVPAFAEEVENPAPDTSAPAVEAGLEGAPDVGDEVSDGDAEAGGADPALGAGSVHTPDPRWEDVTDQYGGPFPDVDVSVYDADGKELSDDELAALGDYESIVHEQGKDQGFDDYISSVDFASVPKEEVDEFSDALVTEYLKKPFEERVGSVDKGLQPGMRITASSDGVVPKGWMAECAITLNREVLGSREYFVEKTFVSGEKIDCTIDLGSAEFLNNEYFASLNESRDTMSKMYKSGLELDALNAWCDATECNRFAGTAGGAGFYIDATVRFYHPTPVWFISQSDGSAVAENLLAGEKWAEENNAWRYVNLDELGVTPEEFRRGPRILDVYGHPFAFIGATPSEPSASDSGGLGAADGVPVAFNAVDASVHSFMVGDVVTVRFSGFTPGTLLEAVLRSDPVLLGSDFKVNDNGSVDVSFTAPAELGEHTVTGTASDGKTAVYAFTVTEPKAAAALVHASGGGDVPARLPDAGSKVGVLAVGALSTLLAGAGLLAMRRRYARV